LAGDVSRRRADGQSRPPRGIPTGKPVNFGGFPVNITGGSKVGYWLVVSTPLKNISQLGLLFPIYGKIKNVPNHQPG